MDPLTIALISAGVSAAAQGAGSYYSGKKSEKAGKRRAKEMRRETEGNMFDSALQRSAELQAHRLASRQKLGKRQSQSMQDTSDLVRGALSI